MSTLFSSSSLHYIILYHIGEVKDPNYPVVVLEHKKALKLENSDNDGIHSPIRPPLQKEYLLYVSHFVES